MRPFRFLLLLSLSTVCAHAGDSSLQRAYKKMQKRLDGENRAHPALAPRNAKEGRRLASLCLACHNINPGEPSRGTSSDKSYVGPSLFGVVGREMGSLKDYEYSAAFKKLRGRVWTEKELYAYLKHPAVYAPGTKMKFEGVLDPQDRLDVIAFLKTLK